MWFSHDVALLIFIGTHLILLFEGAQSHDFSNLWSDISVHLFYYGQFDGHVATLKIMEKIALPRIEGLKNIC